MSEGIATLMASIRGCRICVENPERRPLPHEPRPVAVLSETARVAICGQAPGTRVHASGIPFTDPSGERLREWMGVDTRIFYDSRRVAIVPMGFCFPGVDKRGSDLPPRKECARHWRARVFAAMPQIGLMLLVGHHAQKWHLGAQCRSSLTETVGDWRDILAATNRPAMMPLPHPSWRNNAWIRKNTWFSNELLPELRRLVQNSI